MKRVLFFVAVATLFFSCQKEIEYEPTQQQEGFAFTASIDNLAAPTKADINDSYDLIWSAGDNIGIYVNGWAENSHQQFDLVGDGGSTTGRFVRHQDSGWFETDAATAAYYPYGGGNNVSEGRLYITLPQHYGSDEAPTYTSGKMLTPLVAPVVYSGTEWVYNPIAFKHAGAAVKLTINNLPAFAHSISLTADQPVFGYFNIAVSDAGTADMVENSPGVNTGNNTCFIHFATSSTERPFTFLFPVPALTTPDLAFNLYDKNDVKIWGRTASNQHSLGHGDLLAMPALTLTSYYAQFTSVSAWGIRGKVNGTTNWDATVVPMITDGESSIVKGVEFAAGDEFKVTDGSDWYPTSSNISVSDAGIYDVIYNHNSHAVKMVATGECPYPSAAHHYTAIKNATELGSTETANCYVITTAGSYKIPVVKGNSSESAGTVGGVELLWETYNNSTDVTPNSVIEAVDWDERDAGHIYFKTPDTLLPGNALIAAKDANGDIIWSWHIWIPATTITNIGEYDVSKKYMMDRNLGAIVATEVPAGDGTVDLRSVGLYYQWGRKDPFVGYKWGKTEVEPSISGASGRSMTKSSTKVTVDESIAIPTTFVTGTNTAGDGNWLSSADNTLWGQDADKTIYDPCPAGYRVPNYDSSDSIWQQVTGLANFSSSTASAGHWWKLGSAVFPYTGCYDYDGGISHPYDRTWLWSAKSNSTEDYGEAQYIYDNSGTWTSQPGWGKRKACGAAIRCVKIDGQVANPSLVGATSVTIDGNMDDWASATAISNSGSIKEWKFGSDASNLYFYFKIVTSDIKDEDGSYNWRRYIYIALDTDNKASTGIKYTGASLNFPGCDAVAAVYPFRGTVPDGQTYPAGVQFVNGEDNQSWTKSPADGDNTGSKVTAYGYISGDYAYLEIGIPRAGIGSPAAGNINVKFSYSHNLTGSEIITIN